MANSNKNYWLDFSVRVLKCLTLQLPDQICHSPYCQLCNSYNVSSENLVLDQLSIPKLSSVKCCGLKSLETVANVDDTLAEMFLEEIPPTEEQLIVGILKILGLVYGWMDWAVYSIDFLSLYWAELHTHFEWFMPMIYRTDVQIISLSTTFYVFII